MDGTGGISEALGFEPSSSQSCDTGHVSLSTCLFIHSTNTYLQGISVRTLMML